MPFHYLGLAGNVRRYSAFTDDFLVPLIPVHKFITYAALFTGAAQLIFLYNLIYSRFKGEIAVGESVGSHLAGMVYPLLSATVRQFWRCASGGVSRSLSVRGAEFHWRLPDADFSGTCWRNSVENEQHEQFWGEKRNIMATTLPPPHIDVEREMPAHNERGGGPRGLAPASGDLRAVKDARGEPTRTGIWVGLSAIAMMFAALTSALYVREGSATTTGTT